MKREIVEMAAERQLGKPSAEQQREIEAQEWRGWCRNCGTMLTGTIPELKAHRCADDHG